MNITDSYNLDAPLTFLEWRKIAAINKDFVEYTKYVKNWYSYQESFKKSLKEFSLKTEYVQLLKDLSNLFDETERKTLFGQINFLKDEDILKIIPYCARKLKEISKSINLERKNLSNHTLKIKNVGSNTGIEKEIKNFILRNYTTKNEELFSEKIPALSAINSSFDVKIEELYENHPQMDLKFSNTENLPLNSLEFATQSNQKYDQFLLPKIAQSPLSSLFVKYLQEIEQENADDLNLSEYLNLYLTGAQKFIGEDQYSLDSLKVSDVYQTNNTLQLNIANNWFYWPSGNVYVGEEDGIKGNHYEPIPINESTLPSIATGGENYENSDLFFADKNGKIEGAWFKGIYNLSFNKEMKLTINNSETVEFLYPWTGYTVDVKTFEWKDYALIPLEPKIYNNLPSATLQKLNSKYFTSFVNNCSSADSIFINKTNLIKNGATAGKTSNFADIVIKNNKYDTIQKSFPEVLDVAFLYKFQHTNIPIGSNDSNCLYWPLGRASEVILEQNPSSYIEDAAIPIPLEYVNVSRNMTGAVAGSTLNDADTIYRVKNSFETNFLIEGAWLKGENVSNLKGSSLNKYLLEKTERRGKMILRDYYESYLIFPGNAIIEYDSRTDSYNFLEALYDDVPTQGITLFKFITEVKKRDKNFWQEIYMYYEYVAEVEDLPYQDNDPSDTCCVSVNGPIQPSLSFKANASSYVSFVWCGPDTYADDVFKFRYHLSDCEYYKEGDHDYSKNLGYLDRVPVNKKDISPWERCKCRCVQYSPIGHAGEKCLDYKMTCDLLFADPSLMGDNFNFKYWKDSRSYNASNSPQFAYFNLFNDSKHDKNIGFGPGSWKTGVPGKKFILQTGKTYTYYRSDLNLPNNVSSSKDFLFFVVQHPYMTIKDNRKDVQNCLINAAADYNDIVLVIDQSLSMSKNNKFDMIYKSIDSLIDKIIPTTGDSQNLLGLIAFSGNSSVIKPLTTRNFDIINGIRQIKNNIDSYQLDEEGTYYSSLLKTGLNAAYEILKNPLQLYNKTLKIKNKEEVLEVLISKGKLECSNLQALIDLQSPKVSYYESVDENNQTEKIFSSLPRSDANKKIIFISDGLNTGEWEELKMTSNIIKNNNVKIYCIDVSELGSKTLQDICNNSPVDESVGFEHYFHLRNFLNVSDLTYNEFGEIFYRKITKKYDLNPRWCKIIKNEAGEWIASDEPSDLILKPGECYVFNHNSFVKYDVFSYNSTSYTVNLKLTGWDYTNNKFNPLEENNSGAKPYWAEAFYNKMIENASANYYNFNKFSMYLGGHQRYFDYYVPFDQPIISRLSFDNNYIYKYIHNGTEQINWTEPVTITTCLTANSWKKLILSEELSNLKELSSKKYSLFSHIVNATDIDSDITLETYSNFKPVFYNYYKISASNASWVQPLQIKNWCKFTYSKLNNVKTIDSLFKIKNILNRNNPTIVSKSNAEDCYSKKEIGGYMLPDKIKLSSYKETGSINFINEDYIKEGEDFYSNPSLYINNTLGVSNVANYSPMDFKFEMPSWYIHQDFSLKTGKLLDVKHNQTLHPYSSYYEEKYKNYYGLNIQGNYQFFWQDGQWTSPEKYPLLRNNKVSLEVYSQRLLDNENNENLGIMDKWSLDLNNINYSLIKEESL